MLCEFRPPQPKDLQLKNGLKFGDQSQKAHTNHFLKYESCVKVGLIWRLKSIFILHEDSENFEADSGVALVRGERAFIFLTKSPSDWHTNRDRLATLPARARLWQFKNVHL